MCPLQLNLRCAQLVLDWAAPCWVVPVTTNCDFFFVLTSQICLSLGRTCSEMARLISNPRTNSPFASHVMPCVNAKLIFVEAFGSMRRWWRGCTAGVNASLKGVVVPVSKCEIPALKGAAHCLLAFSGDRWHRCSFRWLSLHSTYDTTAAGHASESAWAKSVVNIVLSEQAASRQSVSANQLKAALFEEPFIPVFVRALLHGCKRSNMDNTSLCQVAHFYHSWPTLTLWGLENADLGTNGHSSSGRTRNTWTFINIMASSPVESNKWLNMPNNPI